MWDSYEHYQEVCKQIALTAWQKEFTSPVGNYLWFVAELSDFARADQMGAQRLYEWHASFAAGQDGYVGNMYHVYEAFRHHDMARYQCDVSEIHEELMGVSHALHRRWRVVGYPPDYLERSLRAVCNVLHMPFPLATAGINEVLGLRDVLAESED